MSQLSLQLNHMINGLKKFRWVARPVPNQMGRSYVIFTLLYYLCMDNLEDMAH